MEKPRYIQVLAVNIDFFSRMEIPANPTKPENVLSPPKRMLPRGPRVLKKAFPKQRSIKSMDGINRV